MPTSRSRPIYAKHTDRARSAHCSNYHLLTASLRLFGSFMILLFWSSHWVMGVNASVRQRCDRRIKGAKEPGNELARGRRFQGAKVPGSELARVLLADSLRGANWPGSEKARYRFWQAHQTSAAFYPWPTANTQHHTA